MRSIDYRDLEVFSVVAAEGSIRAAALRLNLGQPSVSRRMDRLEQCLGMELLDRSTRGVILTAAGRTLLPYIDRGKDLMDEMFSRLEGSSSTVRLEVWSDATLAPTVMALLCRSLPSFELANRVSSIDKVEDAVLHGPADVGFATRTSAVERIASDQCFTDRLVCVVHPGHPLASTVAVSAADLSKHATAVLDWSEAAPVVRSLVGAHLPPELLRLVAPGSAVSALAEQAGHVGISTRASVGPALAAGRLVELVTTDLPVIQVGVHLLYRVVDADTAAVRAVRRAVGAVWRGVAAAEVTESFAPVPAI